MKWCRIQTPDGPTYGVVEDETVALVKGPPFDRFAATGKIVKPDDAP